MFRPYDNPHNNCVVYSEFYYISSYNQYKALDVYQCPEEAKYYLRDKKACIDDCKKDDEYKYLYNGNCIKTCPTGTVANNFICQVNSDKCILGLNELYLTEKDDLHIIDTYVKTYLSEFGYTQKHVSLYKNTNYSIIIYIKSECIKELSVEMPNVDFKNCYSLVQDAYGITDDLVIVVVDKKNIYNSETYFSFYHPISGDKLKADEICKDESIEVVENLNSLLDQNSSYYEMQSSLTDQGINIFDVNDPFYTDLCYDFDNKLKKDIPLNDRIKDIFPNASLCDEGCQYTGINLEDMTATCDCKFNDIANNNIIKENELLSSAMGDILDLINSSNILVFKCIKYMFKHFTSSYGAWISVALMSAHIAMACTYIFVELAKMNTYILTLTKNYISFISDMKIGSPPKKKLNNRNNKEKNVINKLPDEKLSNNNKIEDNLITIPYSGRSDKKSDKKLNLITDENLIKTSPVEDEEAKEQENIFIEYLSTSLDDMEFDDALVKDKRTFCELFIENLKEDQIIANTFIAEDPLKPRTIKIILFILNIILYFVINGLFFSEEVISELYNVDEDKENFFSFMPRSIERLIYTTLVGIIIGIITDFFFVDEKKIKGIFRRDKDNKKAIKQNIIKLSKEIKIRNIAFIIIVSIILIISFLYLLCFNYVYPYSQIEWIKSSIAIIIIMQALSFLKCFLEISLRYLSFKIKSEKLYKISKIID